MGSRSVVKKYETIKYLLHKVTWGGGEYEDRWENSKLFACIKDAKKFRRELRAEIEHEIEEHGSSYTIWVELGKEPVH